MTNSDDREAVEAFADSIEATVTDLLADYLIIGEDLPDSLFITFNKALRQRISVILRRLK
ncbi:hypothetical protein SAMN05920897_101316 [Alkalispirochaeta americana]|uniref:Uncharacterized protein n=1 Tax=Alkalispirochaeta americana TaxID=159291 RepID=A0A1N6NLH4_9SPIO|nr:hypothetical protein [Alkalispirochaeta americana]SIP92920.1 hypothetical protein SAMN05920897_101316 [Alkalispirochaeta americana]